MRSLRSQQGVLDRLRRTQLALLNKADRELFDFWRTAFISHDESCDGIQLTSTYSFEPSIQIDVMFIYHPESTPVLRTSTLQLQENLLLSKFSDTFVFQDRFSSDIRLASRGGVKMVSLEADYAVVEGLPKYFNPKPPRNSDLGGIDQPLESAG